MDRRSFVLPRAQRDLLRMLGYSYQRHGRTAQAAVVFGALHALEPDDAFVAQSLAHAHLTCGKPKPALDLLDRLLDRGDTSALTHLLRGQALGQLGRLPEAARSMRFYIAARSQETLPEEP